MLEARTSIHRLRIDAEGIMYVSMSASKPNFELNVTAMTDAKRQSTSAKTGRMVEV